jgi:hypothetical protein
MAVINQLDVAQAIADRLIELAESSVEGVYVGGSLAEDRADRYADVDLGIASRDTPADLLRLWATRQRLLESVGPPIATLDRRWAHVRMVAGLFGRSQFPPMGLQVDLVFSRLRHVGEQMPGSAARVLFDRTGRLAATVGALDRRAVREGVRTDLHRRLRWFLFFVHDARKAERRGDPLELAAQLESMRQAVYVAAAARAGEPMVGVKRASHYLTDVELGIVEASCRGESGSIEGLAGIFLDCLRAIGSSYGAAGEAEAIERALDDLL